MNRKSFERTGPGSAGNTPQTNQRQQAGPSNVGQQIFVGLLTRQELARRWNCCAHTIARRKDLTPVRLGPRLLRYRISDVEAIETSALVGNGGGQ
jgi:hypothetical protein